MNLLMVFAFAGDSTMTRFLAIAERRTARRTLEIPRARIMREGVRPYQSASDRAKNLRRVDDSECSLSTGRALLDRLERDPDQRLRRIAHGLRHQDLVRLRNVLAELRRGVHFGAEHIGVADAQHAPEAESDAEQHVLLRHARGVVADGRLLHLDRRADRLLHVAEDDEEAVAFDLQQDPVVLLDDGDEDPLRLVDRLEKVDDPELRDVAREAGEIGGHDAPLLTEEIPDALIDRLAIGRRFDARLDQLLDAVL